MKKMYVVIKQTVMEGVDILHVEMMSENLEDCKKYLDDLAEQNDGKCGIQDIVILQIHMIHLHSICLIKKAHLKSIYIEKYIKYCDIYGKYVDT